MLKRLEVVRRGENWRQVKAADQQAWKDWTNTQYAS